MESMIMVKRYRLLRADELPIDAVVVVHVRVVHGQTVGEVACVNCSAAEDVAVAGFPRPMAVALERAEELRAMFDLEEVMISLAPGARWNPVWGDLIDRRSTGKGHIALAVTRQRGPARPHQGRDRS